MIASRLSDL